MRAITHPLTFAGALICALTLLACDEDAAVDTRDTDTTPTDTTPSGTCGDGTRDPGESCDDGQDNGMYDACATDCLGPGPRCGDGLRQQEHELCDDGIDDNGQYGKCGAACQGLAPHCGNGFVDGGGEVCDDGEDNGAYGFCLSDCAGDGPRCGDGTTDDPWELCDDGDLLNGTADHCGAGCGNSPGCGDGEIVPPEVCDDGEENGAYQKCTRDCSGPGPGCGDGVTQDGDEACDHGEDNGKYGFCAPDCQALGPRCGDGNLDGDDERCDDGDDNGGPGQCRHDCTGKTMPWAPLPDRSTAAAARLGDTCDAHSWFTKYGRYRLRLRGNGSGAYPGFVSIGLGAGASMPAARREPNVDCHRHWEFGSCPQEDWDDAQGMYKWGDGTVWLGHYIQMLALEYGVFSRLGLDLSETTSDLYYALEALNRVDEAAETYFGVAPARDGFFLRDDVPTNFVKRADGSYRFPREDGANRGYECLNADTVCAEVSVEDGSFTSLDQTVHLIQGLAFVAKLVPASVVVEGVGLRYQAREQVHRLVSHLRDGGWRVTSPDGTHPPDAWGGNAIGFSNQMAKVANAVCGTDFGVDDYRTLSSRTLGQSAWNGIQAIWDTTHNYNRTMALQLAAVANEWSADKMARQAVGDGKDVFALMHAIFNDAPIGEAFSDWRVEQVLDSAPCGGPCRDLAGCVDAPGWKAESRIFGPDDRSGSRHYPNAEFNGLDYMVIHNAYFLYKRGQYGFSVPRAAQGGCTDTSFKGLDHILSAGPAGVTSYDPTNACAIPDLKRRFGGRNFASWLDDAYRGVVTIFTNGARWACEDGQPCTLTAVDSDEHTGEDDLIVGGPGDDELEGGAGNDCLVGLAGNDKLEGGQGFDFLYGGDGDDELYGESSGIVLSGEQDELYGGPGRDLLKGGPDDDALYGEGDDDELIGDSGNDLLEGGDGNDVLKGDSGEDVLTGGPGDDALTGDSGPDILWGGPGRDRLRGDSGADYLSGEDGDDFLRGGDGDDTLIAGAGQDRLCGNGGDDTLWGNWDGDMCRGGGFLGGTDAVRGCDDDTASQSECGTGAFDDW